MRELSTVRQPNLARVLDWGVEGDLSLRRLRKRSTGPTWPRSPRWAATLAANIVAELGAQAAAALAALHAHGIVHGGVTPVTMVRTADGDPHADRRRHRHGRRTEPT